MQNFLQQVIDDVKKNEGSFEQLTFVLPSKRAGVFLKNYLKTSIGQVQILPNIVSLEEFIAELSGLELIDSTALLFELYTVYKSQPATAIETFDKFSKWAQIILQDFNEITRHLIDADALFSYLSDVKRIEQLLQEEPLTQLIHNQLKFYEQMPMLFEGLNQRLLQRKLAYQGLQYQVAVESIEDFLQFNKRRFVFAGFNALNTAEELILTRLKDANTAYFYWDIDEFFIENNHNAAQFIKKYLDKFKQGDTPSWVSNHFSEDKNIQIIGVPKKIGQVKQVAAILANLQEKDPNFQHTALVLADENLLNPTISALPTEVDRVNITMGLDISNLPMATFYQVLFSMHLQAKGERFYFKEVIEILHYANQFNLLDFATVTHAIQRIKSNNSIYLTEKQVSALHPKLIAITFLFGPWANNCQKALKCMLRFTTMVTYEKDSILQREARQGLISILQALLNLNETYGYMDSIKVLHHYYQQLLSTEKLSFKGEPLSGLQIMGMLETRALDFETIIITSVNENILPAGKSNNSFIPFDIKKEYKIPTYIEKNAIFSYHFFRLLQRSKNIYLLFNTEADDYGSGEQSRFLTQLSFYKKEQVSKQLISPKVYPQPIRLKSIEKDNFALNTLRIKANKGFSPSALTSYLRNPIDFYKRYVLGIYEDEKVEEFVAANTLGTIIHDSLENLYQPYLHTALSLEIIDIILKKSESVVNLHFEKAYKSGSFNTGKNLLIFHVAKQFVQNFIKYERKQLQQGHQIELLALEEKVQMPFTVKQLDFPINLSGKIDRVDRFNGSLRIIDYKTGVVEPSELMIKEWDDLILNDKKSKVFQVMCYALIYRYTHQLSLSNSVLETGIYSFKRLKHGFIKVNKSSVTEEDLVDFEVQLTTLLCNIFNPKYPFEEKVQKVFSY